MRIHPRFFRQANETLANSAEDLRAVPRIDEVFVINPIASRRFYFAQFH
jgi:hypothetical protein